MEIHDDRECDDPIRVLVGTQTGLLKEVELVSGTGEIKHGSPARDSDVLSLAPGRSPREVLLATKKGVVTLLLDFRPVLIVRNFASGLAGAAMLDEGRIGILTADGKVYILDPSQFEARSAVDAARLPVALQVNAPAEQLAVAPGCRNLIAVGGQENRLRVWDVNEGTKVYEARNPPNDWLCLAVPVWISGLAFQYGPKPTLVAMVTRHHDLQLFDTEKEDRRPVWKESIGEEPLNCVAFSPDNTKLFTGSAAGFVYVSDAKTGKLLGRMAPSAAGSIRSLHVTDTHVYATGLDRFVYSYKLSTRQAVHKVYAKQRMSRIMLSEMHRPQNEDEEDDMWFGLATKPAGQERKREKDEDANEEEEEEAIDKKHTVDVKSAPTGRIDPARDWQKSLKRLKKKKQKTKDRA